MKTNENMNKIEWNTTFVFGPFVVLLKKTLLKHTFVFVTYIYLNTVHVRVGKRRTRSSMAAHWINTRAGPTNVTLHRRLSCQHWHAVNGHLMTFKWRNERAGAGHVIILPRDTKILCVWQRRYSGLKTLAQIQRVNVHKWRLTLFRNGLFLHSWHAESHLSSQIVLSCDNPS